MPCLLLSFGYLTPCVSIHNAVIEEKAYSYNPANVLCQSLYCSLNLLFTMRSINRLYTALPTLGVFRSCRCTFCKIYSDMSLSCIENKKQK